MATSDTLNQKFSEICRLCLKQDGVMGSIFQTADPEEGEFSLAQRISTIARVQIQVNDGLPMLICHVCRNQVEKSYNFRLLVEISDRTLRGCLESKAEEERMSCMIKQELSDNQEESADEENINLEQFLMENNLTDSNIDPAAINVILVQSEDGTQVLNICSIDDAQDSETSNMSREIKEENSEHVEKSGGHMPSEFSKEDEVGSELDDLEGMGQFLAPEKMYIQSTESQIKTIYSCSECNEIFLAENQLTNHLSTKHAEDSEYLAAYNMNVNCQLCFETFESLAELKNHISKHFDEGRSMNSVKSTPNAGEAEEEQSETVGDVLNDDYHYVLEVSRSNNNRSGETIGIDLDEDVAAEDVLLEVNANEDSSKSKRSDKDLIDQSDMELEMELEEDAENKAKVLYCLTQYFSEQEKSRGTNSYRCTQCEKMFTNKHEYTLHLRRHFGIKPFKCGFCEKAFITNALRKEHERQHTGDKTFVCVVCGKSFVKKSELKYHEGIHTDTPSTCGICKKEFSNIQSFKMHTKRHVLGSRYVCETCGKSYYTNSELARHIQTHSGKREYPCPVCETSFLSRPELNRHLRYHIGKKMFSCKICYKSYFESGHLKIHERVHTGEKPYVCSICKKAFVTKPKLVRHQKIHAKEQALASATVKDKQNSTAFGTDAIS